LAKELGNTPPAPFQGERPQTPAILFFAKDKSISYLTQNKLVLDSAMCGTSFLLMAYQKTCATTQFSQDQILGTFELLKNPKGISHLFTSVRLVPKMRLPYSKAVQG
jgi:hypothetical protein